MKKNNLVRTDKDKDEWYFGPRQHFTVHKDLQDEAFDKMPMREGSGRQVCKLAYATNVLNRWLRAHLGEPWHKVQQLLRTKVSNDQQYKIACDNVQKTIIINGVEYISRHNWFGGKVEPVSEGSFFTDTFYVDKNGILREAERKKYKKLPQPIKLVKSSDGYIWFKRNNIVYKALQSDAVLYDVFSSIIQSRRIDRRKVYYSFGSLIYWDGNNRMQIKTPSIKQASHKDLNHYADDISKINQEVIQNAPD